MSQPRFAPMTAALFVRNMPPSPTLVHMPQPADEELKVLAAERPATAHRPPSEAERPHKVRIGLSDAEFEAFSIAAVKRGISRQQILRGALNRYLDELARDYRETCACLAQGAYGKSCDCKRAS